MAVVKIPEGMETPRFRADRQVKVQGEIPLIDPGAPPAKQVRERYLARCKVFNLMDAAELAAYQDIWQAVCDGKAVMSESVVNEDKLVAFLRWSEIEYVAPGTAV